MAVSGVPSANSGHCSAILDAVATLCEPATQCETCSALLQPLYCQLPIPPSNFPLRGSLERHGHDSRKRLWPCPGQDPSLQDPRNVTTPRLKNGTPYSNDHAARWSYKDAGAISARPRTTPRTTATPGAIPHGVLPAVLDHCAPAIQGEDDDFHDLLSMYTGFILKNRENTTLSTTHRAHTLF